MAQPTKPLYVWAEQDVILPTANRPNKKTPQQSLILTGYDQSQKPAADEWNDLFNTITLWLQYIKDEKITDIENTKVNRAGDTMTGNLTAPTFIGALSGNSSTATKLATARTISLTGDATGSASFDGSANATITVVVQDDSHNHVISNVDGLQAALDSKSTVSVLTGTLSNGETIPLPAGYTEAQCKWLASPSVVNNSGSNDINNFQCTLSGRVVTITTESTVTTGNLASYIIIGVK